MKTTEQLTSLDEIQVGPQLHKSNENICYLGKFRDEEVVLKKVIVSRAESLTKFEEEIEILCKPELKEHLVAPVAVVRAAPHYSIVLPYMANGSINTLLTRCELPLELVICFALDAAKGLAALHKTGLVHRDIKSANILIGQDFRASLTDFGSCEKSAQVDENGEIIRVITDTSELSAPSGGYHKSIRDGTTLGYTAPEVLANKPAVFKSDIYGLAMTMAEMLTGIPPFQGMEKEDADMHTVMDASYSEHALLVAITVDQLRPGLVTTSEKAGMPIEIFTLIRAMWHHEIAARPTAEQVVETLTKLAEKLGVDTSFGKARKEYAASIANKRSGSVDANNALLEPQQQESDEMDVVDDHNLSREHQVHDVATVPVHIESMDVDSCAMGQPVKFNRALPIGAFATSGRRGADKMEDRHSVHHFSLGEGRGEMTICTIFDGHGGKACAHFTNARLGSRLGKALLGQGKFLSEEDRSKVVKTVFVETDLEYRNSPQTDKSGCTAIAMVLWHPDIKAQPNHVRVMIANAGDCRAVLCRSSENGQDTAIRLSRDHDASDPKEQDRIRAAGGEIKMTRDGKHRVNGHIQVTRAIGDAAMKPYGVTAEPEILEYDLDADNGDDFILMATDGVWDTLTDSAAVTMVRSTAKECGLAAKRIGGEALARGSTDNITSAVVFLKSFDQHQDIVYKE